MKKSSKFLKAEDEEEAIALYGVDTNAIKLITFAFNCWAYQGYKDASGRKIKKMYYHTFLAELFMGQNMELTLVK